MIDDDGQWNLHWRNLWANLSWKLEVALLDKMCNPTAQEIEADPCEVIYVKPVP